MNAHKRKAILVQESDIGLSQYITKQPSQLTQQKEGVSHNKLRMPNQVTTSSPDSRPDSLGRSQEEFGLETTISSFSSCINKAYFAGGSISKIYRSTSQFVLDLVAFYRDQRTAGVEICISASEQNWQTLFGNFADINMTTP